MPQPSEHEIEVFNVALELPVAQRSAYLDRACARDTALRQRVEALLQASEESCACLEGSAAVSPGSEGTARLSFVPTEKPGDRIGRYKLLQQIGEGGCGVVYMAEQEEPVQRRIALKVIKLGMDTKQVIARFEAERQALALMDHPNIAKVLDAGATDAGRPYFVMELVRGIKITDYCDQNNLSTRERLDLFIQVCRAIQHAHQKGIIHRDIKPSNILVTMDDRAPVPKVIDFGIAKATQGKLTDHTLFTAFEQFVGTPAYMSPEQAEMRMLDIDTRSDIYSLGVLLYELLTGQTPFSAEKLLQAGLDEIRRTIREREPARPSTRLSTMLVADLDTVAGHRQVPPPKLIHLVRGDLDWIVMKALEKDRTRRYETANGFARDIERYLADEPVLACPPSNLYRFQKLVRRNRLAVFSGALVTLSLVLGIVLSTWQAVRATRAEREQRLLRQQAEAGRAAEAALRRVDEIRAQVASARIFFDAANYDEAEKALQRIPASGQPQPEHTALLRLIGSQRADQGQWKEAAADFSAVMRLNASDKADIIGLDFLRYGPVLVELGDTNQYRQFVRETIARFAGTSDPLMAERACKICLLMPADGETLRQLGAFYAVATNTLNEFTDPDAKRWACVSLAIFEYRRGNYAQAAEWSSITLTGNVETYLAIAHVIRAMSLQQLAHGTAGQVDFVQGTEAIYAAEKKGLNFESHGIEFFDWMYGRILQREAGALIEALPAAGSVTPAEATALSGEMQQPNQSEASESVLGEEIKWLLNRIPGATLQKEAGQTQGIYSWLGWWHLYHGRVRQAADHWEVVAFGPGDGGSLKTGSDLSDFYLSLAPVLVELGDTAGYEKFRKSALAAFGNTGDPINAERTLTSCLLLPPDQETMKMLGKLSDVVTNVMRPRPDWEPRASASRALLEYRRGNFQFTTQQAARILASTNASQAQSEGAHILTAMACYRLNQLEKSTAELAQCRETIELRFGMGVGGGADSSGVWYDWWFAHILLREATALIEGKQIPNIQNSP